eukprot:241200-Rhodomonas_salina.1
MRRRGQQMMLMKLMTYTPCACPPHPSLTRLRRSATVQLHRPHIPASLHSVETRTRLTTCNRTDAPHPRLTTRNGMRLRRW